MATGLPRFCANFETALRSPPYRMMQWTRSGGLLDLARIGKRVVKLGTALVLDLTQVVGVYPFDVKAVHARFRGGVYVTSGCWDRTPLGLMYVAPKWQGGLPLEENWIQRSNARDFSSLIVYTERV